MGDTWERTKPQHLAMGVFAPVNRSCEPQAHMALAPCMTKRAWGWRNGHAWPWRRTMAMARSQPSRAKK